MQFRDLKTQYQHLKPQIDEAILKVTTNCNFIMGEQVAGLEHQLAEYVGVKHCITCANGTDALSLAMMTFGIKKGDAVFVPDFTFFSSGEIVALAGATPIFVDVCQNTYNIDCNSLEKMIKRVIEKGDLIPKAIVAVDLFGLPADYVKINQIANKYKLLIIEDGAQGFGGSIDCKMACSFGDIATTSFFPAKPLGCYGDGGAVFTDNDHWAKLLKSYRIHGKGESKYDNIRVGMNSRLDTIQAAVLQVKLNAFREYELAAVNNVAGEYTEKLNRIVKTPVIPKGFIPSWAQYTIQLANKEERDRLQQRLKDAGIPSMIYYQKPMHRQSAFDLKLYCDEDYETTNALVDTVLSLPMHPYLAIEDVNKVLNEIETIIKQIVVR